MLKYGETVHSDLAKEVALQLKHISRMTSKKELHKAVHDVIMELTVELEKESGPFAFTVVFNWLTRSAEKQFTYLVETVEAKLEKTQQLGPLLPYLDAEDSMEPSSETEELEPELALFAQLFTHNADLSSLDVMIFRQNVAKY